MFETAALAQWRRAAADAAVAPAQQAAAADAEVRFADVQRGAVAAGSTVELEGRAGTAVVAAIDAAIDSAVEARQ
eukprot:2783391-Pyramimonas_sp.AAC.1